MYDNDVSHWLKWKVNEQTRRAWLYHAPLNLFCIARNMKHMAGFHISSLPNGNEGMIYWLVRIKLVTFMVSLAAFPKDWAMCSSPTTTDLTMQSRSMGSACHGASNTKLTSSILNVLIKSMFCFPGWETSLRDTILHNGNSWLFWHTIHTGKWQRSETWHNMFVHLSVTRVTHLQIVVNHCHKE